VFLSFIDEEHEVIVRNWKTCNRLAYPTVMSIVDKVKEIGHYTAFGVVMRILRDGVTPAV